MESESETNRTEPNSVGGRSSEQQRLLETPLPTNLHQTNAEPSAATAAAAGQIPPAQIEDIFADHEQSRRDTLWMLWRRANLCFVGYFAPLTIALVTVLIKDWNDHCEKPLQIWGTVQAAIQFVLIVFNCILFCQRRPTEQDPSHVCVRIVNGLNRLLNVLWFGWFILGMVWTFQTVTGDCPKTAPDLFRLCLSIVIIQLVVIGIFLLICCCTVVIFLLRLACCPPAGVQPIIRRGVTKRQLRKLTEERTYGSAMTAGLVTKEHSTCAVCLADYEESDAIRFLPCRHHFHRDCIDRWLKSNKSCPFCKRNVDAMPLSQPAPPATSQTNTTSQQASDITQGGAAPNEQV